MKTNTSMDKLLQVYGETESRQFSLSSKLSTLLESRIEERDKTFCFTSLRSTISEPVMFFGDLTGYECAVNHIHIDDFLEPGSQQKQGLLFRSAIAFAYRLKEKLISTFPKQNFNIILGYSLGNPPGCTVRFHKIRENESWISDNLDGYEAEAVMVLDTPEE